MFDSPSSLSSLSMVPASCSLTFSVKLLNVVSYNVRLKIEQNNDEWAEIVELFQVFIFSRCLTLGRVLHLQTLYHQCLQWKKPRHHLIYHYITGCSPCCPLYWVTDFCVTRLCCFVIWKSQEDVLCVTVYSVIHVICAYVRCLQALFILRAKVYMLWVLSFVCLQFSCMTRLCM